MNRSKNNFDVGDIVRLKSGGPQMTVARIIGEKGDLADNLLVEHQGLSEGDVVCTWFDGGSKEESGFPLSTLEPVEES